MSNPSSASSAKLLHVCAKHRATEYRKPLSDHTRQAFLSVLPRLRERMESHAPCILDSCCGTAQSTSFLARTFEHGLVVGIDRSEARLHAARDLPSNAIVLRAECVDFWRLCADHGIVFAQHTLWYPNPYPKSEHLVRRWYAHPVFPTLLRISRDLELRTNMQWYADDTATVLRFHGLQPTTRLLPNHKETNVVAVSAFEKKYMERGEQLWQLHCSLR